MIINDKAKKSFIGARITDIQDGVMFFSNGQGIVITDEEAIVINGNFKETGEEQDEEEISMDFNGRAITNEEE